MGSLILTGLTAHFLNEHDINLDDYLMLSITLFLTTICTFFTKDVYIKDKEDNKIKVDFKSSLFYRYGILGLYFISWRGNSFY